MTEFRLNAYHIMWLFVFFDLPVTTKREQKVASEFRKNLLRDGFVMMQFSVYIRHCASHESLVAVTDKQYADMETVFGKAAKKEIRAPIQLEFF